MPKLPNILIIDDSSFLRKSVGKLLSENEMNVFEAENLAQVRNNRFSGNKKLSDMDLVLLDIYLKGEKGFDILPYLRNEYPTLPVVILSMDDSKETVLRAFSLKANDYILKPFDEQKLIDKVNYYINLDEQCIINPRQCSVVERQPRDEFDYFQVDLSTEISRSLRSELSFSIVELSLKPEREGVINKEKLLNLIRDIDQLYSTKESNYLFLLPLTNREGVQKFINRLKEEFQTKFNLEYFDFINTITFPSDITKYVSKTRAVKYQQEILEKLQAEDR
ncbi:response regulator [Halanaerobacter jeridensis]|uniref:Stage 0 sporulation protein A homolog n=1 Tax=Halanaerobacter jeridensis TaxID=706427 RepID=A0A938XZ78_9FIRM|nr:response regulator [Halanaerobacter jeridensis]MBM7558015.1 DNA-binding response OmpR family regulator [Halanaerobacter jeridensis]